jgi:hypothetical protein
MKEIYRRLWRLAKPYYQKGRPLDLEQFEQRQKEFGGDV